MRCDEPVDEEIRRKIALFCNVKPDCVIENITLPVLYEAPVMLEKNNFSDIVCRELGIHAPEPDMRGWIEMLSRIKNRTRRVTIGLVGKYVKLHDAYLSVAEALRHAGYESGAFVDINWIDSEGITPENVEQQLAACDGIILPGGFGDRGIEGMITAAGYARTHNIPYFGICLGMQIAVIEYAAMCADWQTPTPVSLRRIRHIRSSILCRTRMRKLRKAAPCVWVLIRAILWRIRRCMHVTAGK